MTIETTIRNDLPVLVSAELYGPFVEYLEIRLLNGDEFPGELSGEDEERIVDELVQACNEPPC